MRWLLCLSIGLLLAGCGKKDNLLDASAPARSPNPASRPGKSKPVKPQATQGQQRSGPIVTASDAAFGRVLSVNANLRFAVIDFGLRRLPDPGTRLSVFRNGLKVGEVKITEWRQESNTVGDITAGELRYGDEVRPD